jgi:hypothetical protein
MDILEIKEEGLREKFGDEPIDKLLDFIEENDIKIAQKVKTSKPQRFLETANYKVGFRDNLDRQEENIVQKRVYYIRQPIYLWNENNHTLGYGEKFEKERFRKPDHTYSNKFHLNNVPHQFDAFQKYILIFEKFKLDHDSAPKKKTYELVIYFPKPLVEKINKERTQEKVEEIRDKVRKKQ